MDRSPIATANFIAGWKKLLVLKRDKRSITLCLLSPKIRKISEHSAIAEIPRIILRCLEFFLFIL